MAVPVIFDDEERAVERPGAVTVNNNNGGAPSVVCKSDDLPVLLLSPLLFRPLHNTVLLRRSEDEIVVSGAVYAQESYHVTYGYKILKFETKHS